MSRPASRTQKKQIYTAQARQIWLVLLLTGLGVVYDITQGAGFIATKSVFVGALLHFLAQSVFTFFAYRAEGTRARQQIMLNMYLGQMLKWLISLLGFALIFIYQQPITAALVIIGYFIMQLCHIISMWRLR